MRFFWGGREKLYLCDEELGLVCEDLAVETLGVAEWKPLFLELAELLDVFGLATTDNGLGQRLLILQMICDVLMDLTDEWRSNSRRKRFGYHFDALHLLAYLQNR